MSKSGRQKFSLIQNTLSFLESTICCAAKDFLTLQTKFLAHINFIDDSPVQQILKIIVLNP